MRRIILTIMLGISILHSAKADASLVAHWTFDSKSAPTTWLDSSGNGHTASCNPSSADPCPVDIAGVIGNGVLFDGINDALQVENDFALTNEMTIMTWLYLNDLTGPKSIFYNAGHAGGFGERYFLKKWDYDNRFMLELGDVSGGTPHFEFFNSTPAIANEWIHLAVTYDSSAVKFYYNGNPDGTTIASGVITSTEDGQHPIIGDLFNTQFFAGKLDELRIYDHALPQEEILRDGGFIPTETNVIPEPSTMFLFGAGLFGSIIRRRAKAHYRKMKNAKI